MSIINTIKSCPLFFELYDEEIESIVEKCNVMSLSEGESVFLENDEGNEIFLILNGEALVKKGNTTLVTLSKGDLFGEMVLLDERTRTADVVAGTYTDVLVIDFDAIFGIFSIRPKIFSILMLNLCRLLAKRLKNSSTTIRELNAKIAKINAEDERKVA